MRSIKIILLVIYTFFMVLFLCGCNESQNDNTLDNKIYSEIEYLDKQLIGVMNKLNNITLENYEVKNKDISLESKSGNEEQNSGKSNGSNEVSGEGSAEESSSQEASSEGSQGGSENGQSSNNIKVLQMQPSNILVIDRNDIDWVTIKSQIEIMYSTWHTILLDLYSLDLENNGVLNFGKALDDAIIMAKSEDKVNTLVTLANLYSYLPVYAEKISIDESKKNILKTKANILNAYAFVEQDNWNEVQNQINQADDNYSKVISDVNYIKNNQEQINRVNVLIKELKNSINLHDKDIFYIKYKTIMNSI